VKGHSRITRSRAARLFSGSDVDALVRVLAEGGLGGSQRFRNQHRLAAPAWVTAISIGSRASPALWQAGAYVAKTLVLYEFSF